MPADFDWKAFLTPHRLAHIANNRMRPEEIAHLIVMEADVAKHEATKIVDRGPPEVSDKRRSEEYREASVSTKTWRTAEQAIRDVRKLVGDEAFSLLAPQGLATMAMRTSRKPVPRNPYVYEQMLKVMRW